MKFRTQLTLVLFAFVVGYAYKIYRDLSAPRPLPKIDLDAYWGPGHKRDYTPNTSVHPFSIEFSKEAATLRKQLSQSLPLHAPLEGVGFEYGVNSDGLNEIIRFWRDDYLPRWEKREDFLNQFPQFTTQIQGLNIHFIHVQPIETEGKTTVPLLMLHGWPGSIREFYGVIPKLIESNPSHDVVFEVIAPSLPGYGFSQASAKTGHGPAEMAVILRNLMLRLGHRKFMIVGGDWGALIGTNIATIFPENVYAFYTTACFISTPMYNIKSFLAGFNPSAFVPSPELAEYHYPQSEKFLFMIVESGYMHIQSTKPDTIGTALTGNPVGLLAYIVEKFSTWTKPEYAKLNDGGWSVFDAAYKDAILDNIMIYHLSNCITTSQRLYSEAFTFKQLALELDRVPTDVPVGYARYRNDLIHAIDWQITDKFTNLIHSTYLTDGGHFAAMEQPQLYFDDFTKFVTNVEFRRILTRI